MYLSVLRYTPDISTHARNYQDRVQTICETGFYVKGAAERVCEATTEWSGVDPSCLIRMCPAVNELQDGEVSLTKGTEFGSKVAFECDEGFYLVGGDAAGEASAECVEDAANPNLGKWSAHPPTCKVRDCGTLPPPEVVGGRKEDAPASKTILVGGGVGEGETVYKASAEFACHEGYDLNDSSRKSTCLASGKWSGKAGKCAIKVR